MDLKINGEYYPWPEKQEKNYSKKVNSAIKALVESSLQKIGGEFRLKNRLKFGSAHGIEVKEMFFNKHPDKSFGIDEQDNVAYGDQKLAYEANVSRSLTEINGKLSEISQNLSKITTDLTAVKSTAENALSIANKAKKIAESYEVIKGDFDLDVIGTNADSAKCWGKYIKSKYTVELFGKTSVTKAERSTGPSRSDFKWPEDIKPSSDVGFVKSTSATNTSQETRSQ